MDFASGLKVIECCDLPERTEGNAAYRLMPKNANEEYYLERTDRNIGWITREEQEMLRKKVVGIAGCGGMGGFLGQILARLGVGEIRICDTEVFDVSNINRQFGATRTTVGFSKALVTAQKIRETTDDNCLVVYPQGITEATVDGFLDGCDIVCDEIEFWAIGSRILLHERARTRGISVFCCNTIGFGTRLFYFTPTSATMEECLGISLNEAMCLQKKFQNRTASREEIIRMKDSAINGLLPEIPRYREDGEDQKEVHRRKLREGKSPIISTNPPMATGFLADRILLHLLEKNSVVKRSFVAAPKMPGYLYFDAAKMETRVIKEKWWPTANTPLAVLIAESEEDFASLYRLRYDVYCHELRSLDPNEYPNHEERDAYDEYSVHIVVKAGMEVVGTMRLIKDGPLGFLMEQQFTLPRTINRAKTVEHSRLVIRNDHRGKGMLPLMLKKAYAWQQAQGYTTCIGAAVMSTLGHILLRSGYKALLTEPVPYHNVSVLPVMYDLEKTPPLRHQ